MPNPLPPLEFDQTQFWILLGSAFTGLGVFARWSFGQLFRRMDDAIEAFKSGMEKVCSTFQGEIKACHEGRKEEQTRLLETIIELSKGKQP